MVKSWQNLVAMVGFFEARLIQNQRGKMLMTILVVQ